MMEDKVNLKMQQLGKALIELSDKKRNRSNNYYILHLRGARYLYLNESEFKKNIENNFNYSILGQINKNVHVEIKGIKEID